MNLKLDNLKKWSPRFKTQKSVDKFGRKFEMELLSCEERTFVINRGYEVKYCKIMPQGNVVPHREGDLPAVIYNKINKEQYYIDGVRHRMNGPAIVTPTVESYYINGIPYAKEVYYNDTEAILDRMNLIDEDE